jgi:periplasmic protein TonB
MRSRLFATLFVFFALGWLVSAQEVFTPGDGVALPTVVKQVRPDYTEAAKAARIEGNVGLQAVVLADGTVGEVSVKQSLDSVNGLDQQAVDALKQWLFKAGTKDGKPVAVRIAVEMTFTLK